MPKGKFTPLTVKDEALIKAEYLNIPVKILATKIGSTYGVIMRRLKKWNLEIPKDLIEQRKCDSHYSKGRTPENKGKKQSEYMSVEAIERTMNTRFQKGALPHNTKYDGHESKTKDGYVLIRISIGNYRLKHIVEWEKINGPLPKSHCLICKDKNKTNTSPGNWTLITRVENMLKNSTNNFPEEIIPSMVLVNKINKQINTLKDGKK